MSDPEIKAINVKYAWVYNYTTAKSGTQVGTCQCAFKMEV